MKMDLEDFLACAKHGLTPQNHDLSGFAAACYDQNSVNDLIAALESRSADTADCDAWEISKTEWRAQIKAALETAMFMYVLDNGDAMLRAELDYAREYE